MPLLPFTASSLELPVGGWAGPREKPSRFGQSRRDECIPWAPDRKGQASLQLASRKASSVLRWPGKAFWVQHKLNVSN